MPRSMKWKHVAKGTALIEGFQTAGWSRSDGRLHSPSREIISDIYEVVFNFSGSASRRDDLTALIIKRRRIRYASSPRPSNPDPRR